MQVDISHFLRAGNRSIIKRNIHFLCCFVFVCLFFLSFLRISSFFSERKFVISQVLEMELNAA